MTNKHREPHSIRCLRAIEAFVGGREKLAKKLELTKFAIDSWYRRERVSPRYVKDLTELGEGKFSSDELLGLKD